MNHKRDKSLTVHPCEMTRAEHRAQGVCVVVTCFEYDTAWGRWQAFRNMGLIPRVWAQRETENFSKMLGSGGGDGFKLWPAWGRYFMMRVWPSEEEARTYLSGGSQDSALSLARRWSTREWSLLARPYLSRGAWGGRDPFQPTSPRDQETNGPILILTRGRVRASQALTFWRNVRHVSAGLAETDGCIYAVGVGELPLIEQATLSLWETEQHMREYAHRGAAHRAVMAQTRRAGWYCEELFARMLVCGVIGELPEPLRALRDDRDVRGALSI